MPNFAVSFHNPITQYLVWCVTDRLVLGLGILIELIVLKVREAKAEMGGLC